MKFEIIARKCIQLEAENEEKARLLFLQNNPDFEDFNLNIKELEKQKFKITYLDHHNTLRSFEYIDYDRPTEELLFSLVNKFNGGYKFSNIKCI